MELNAENGGSVGHKVDTQNSSKLPSSTDSNSGFKVPLLIGPTLGRSVRQRLPLVGVQSRTETNLPVQVDSTNLSPPRDQSSKSTDVINKDQSVLPSNDPVVDEVHTIPTLTVDVPYEEPRWSGLPPLEIPYSFEILKGGVVVGSFDLNSRPYVVCGRHSSCDLVMEHPSISRHHAIIQYRRCDPSSSSDGSEQIINSSGVERPDGFYVYDLGSTHGTFLNKNKLKPRCYYRLFVGHMLRFGGSSRSYLMQGPNDDCEEESLLTVTEMKVMRRLVEQNAARAAEMEITKKKEEEEKQGQGINWGMGEDAVEDEDVDNKSDEDDEGICMGINPFSLNRATPNEDAYIDDPKKTLRSWFEREGFELEYEIEEKGQAHFLCRIRLPLDHSSSGEPIVVEASVKGKKKEAVAACALDACRTLDRQGALRQSKQEGRPRKKRRDWVDDDFYDSDEDTFLDRTGTIEKKRRQRMYKVGGDETGSSTTHGIETYESLLAKYAELNEELLRVEEALSKNVKTDRQDAVNDDDADALDTYMNSLQGETTSAPDKIEKSRLKITRKQLKREGERLVRLINIARPTSLPPLIVSEPSSAATTTMKTLKKNRVSDKKPATAAEKHGKEIVMATNDASENKKTCSNVVDCIKSCPTREQSSEKQLDEDQPADDPTKSIEAGCERTETISLRLAEKELELEKKESKDQQIDISATLESAITEEPKKKRHKAIRKSKEARYDYDKTDPNYAMWIPPDDQSGDGKTSLNEKYGY